MSELVITRNYAKGQAFKTVHLDAIKSAVETLVNGNIDTSNVADRSITTATINNLAVTTAKIADNSIDSVNFADLSVTNVKLGSYNIAYSSDSSATSVGSNDTTIMPITSMSTNGRPVLLMLACGSDNSVSTFSIFGDSTLSPTQVGAVVEWWMDDDVGGTAINTLVGTEVLQWQSGGTVPGATVQFGITPALLKLVVTPRSGVHSFGVRIKKNVTGLFQTNPGWSLFNVRLVALELL